MMSHADTIRDLRYVVAELRTRGETGLADILENATSASVAENQQLREALDDVLLATRTFRWTETERLISIEEFASTALRTLDGSPGAENPEAATPDKEKAGS